MAAPVNGALTNFDQANGPPNNLTQAVDSYAVPPVASNELTWPQFPSFQWDPTVFRTDVEAWCFLSGHACPTGFLLRWQHPNSGDETGIVVTCNIDDVLGPAEAQVWTEGSSSARSLGFSNFIMDPTDVWQWARCVGNRIELYGGTDGLTWNLRQTWSDAQITTPGKIGMWYANNLSAGATIGLFGGGNTSGPITPYPPTIGGRGAM